ncbi:class I SAM-dependent methyltransferase [Candidatus Micrarchaeota archaeon]|nr:class I SAM-dependent methyltransferase [Candidatus Micrarchaeota archaeon]MBU2477146.1 class I SAM-dependent methyltransferase [Candidatus Micrarchaeota archaeon]
MFKEINCCRICNSSNLSEYLDLGKTPLANSLVRPENKDKKEIFFPLKVLFCNNCFLSQLSIVVDPEILFKDYVYRSSVSKTFQNHCNQMAKELKKRFEKENLLVLDIASNDGCLLQEFKKQGFKVIGVEPAVNISKIANENKIQTINAFWDLDTAKKVLEEFGKVNVITATNVLAHVDEVSSFVSAMHYVLDDNGLIVIEVPYAENLIEKNQFDTIYHEHLSYFIFRPLIELFERNNFKVIDVQKVDIHGGTLRVFAAKKTSSRKINENAIQQLLKEEKSKNLYKIETYFQLAKNTEKIKFDLVSLLKEIKEKNQKTAAYGASAKGSTLLNYCNIGTDFIDFIIDDTPEKQNLLTPGKHIPIFPRSFLEENKTDFLLLLSWNFAKEFISKTAEHRKKGGKYILPIPEVKVIESEEEIT